MVETVGKKLQQARQRKQITVEEAARSTRMRPDKIVDLENDNYTNFPNLTYAKGFLLIYSKFLNVDVRDFAETLGTINPVGVENYEYLTASERPQTQTVYRAPRKSLLPLFFAALVVCVALGVMYFIITLKRITAPDTAIAASATPTAARTPDATPTPQPTPEIRRAEPVVPAARAAWAAAPAAASPTIVPEPVPKDVAIKPVKKTWVKITKDVADSAPVYEDWLFPDAQGLKFRGVRFWIKIKDSGAVQITRDGQPVPADSTNVTIQ